MRRRLVLSYLSVVLTVLLLLEIPLGAVVDREQLGGLADQATAEAASVALLAGEAVQRSDGAELTDLVHRYRTDTDTELLITYNSEADVVDSDNEGRQDLRELRAEIRTALAGLTSTESVSDDGHRYYAAVVPIRKEEALDDQTAPVVGVVVLYLPAWGAYHRIHEVWLALAAFLVGMLGLTALIGSRLAERLTRPLAQLEQVVNRLGDGHLSARADPGGPQEIRALAVDFNTMAARLENLVSAQSRFVADASHQLRSPLIALRLRLENMEFESTGAAARSVAAANREVQRLSRLVDGLLALGRADADRPARYPVDVNRVVVERVDSWIPLAEERNVRLGTVLGPLSSPGPRLVPGDLEQILDNLLANALDVTPPGRSVTVETVDSETGVNVAVVDEGPGISDEVRVRAFDRFWQGPGARTGNSGLGLAIVLQLAHRNRATVELLSADPSQPLLGDTTHAGTRAEIRLPI